ncbi:MAG: TetR/AcrR family transcriptional regulator C-terminal domain-containing protein, partial [Flavipsychrobacter sp.]
MKRRNQELVKQIIKEGQKKGVVKKNIDIPMMMATMLGTANQVMTTLPFYKEVNNLADMPEEEFQKLIKKKLTLHLKSIFKAILTYEEQ